MKFSIDFLKTTAKDFLAGARILIVLLGLLLIVLIISLVVDINNKITETENTISISATGEVYAAPDLVLTSFSVLTEAETVIEALAENTEKMNAVIAFVKNEGVADKDIKTTGFNIYPRYEWYKAGSCWPPCPSGRRVLVAYEVRQTLQVKVRDMAKIGIIVQGATEEGANQVSDLQFTIDDEDELKKQARTQAIDEAKTKAETLAAQLDVNLGKVVEFNESGVYPRYYMMEMEETAMGKGGGEDLQIETGENKISVTVTITYEIY